MGKKVKKPHETQSVIKEFANRKTSITQLEEEECFVVSFKHVDPNQGQSSHDWQMKGILADAVETLSGYCQKPLNQQFGKTALNVYGEFPSHSRFRHPAHVPEDAEWARIHVNGVHILAGHILKNTFYLVFWDYDHSFYPTEKKHT